MFFIRLFTKQGAGWLKSFMLSILRAFYVKCMVLNRVLNGNLVIGTIALDVLACAPTFIASHHKILTELRLWNNKCVYRQLIKIAVQVCLFKCTFCSILCLRGRVSFCGDRARCRAAQPQQIMLCSSLFNKHNVQSLFHWPVITFPVACVERAQNKSTYLKLNMFSCLSFVIKELELTVLFLA